MRDMMATKDGNLVLACSDVTALHWLTCSENHRSR